MGPSGFWAVETSLNPARWQSAANDSACWVVQPWLASPRAPGWTKRSMARSRPPGCSTPVCLRESRSDVAPVMHALDRPQHRHRGVRERKVFGAGADPLGGATVSGSVTISGHGTSDSEHVGRRVDARRDCTQPGRQADRVAWTTSDVDDAVADRQLGEVEHEPRGTPSAQQHRQPCQDARNTGTPGVVGVVVDGRLVWGLHSHRVRSFADAHAEPTLVVQANLTSTVAVDHMTIGQAAERLGLKPSALRYYDERGLVPVPVRRAGRRM
jgi:hypothetical protein